MFRFASARRCPCRRSCRRRCDRWSNFFGAPNVSRIDWRRRSESAVVGGHAGRGVALHLGRPGAVAIAGLVRLRTASAVAARFGGCGHRARRQLTAVALREQSVVLGGGLHRVAGDWARRGSRACGRPAGSSPLRAGGHRRRWRRRIISESGTSASQRDRRCGASASTSQRWRAATIWSISSGRSTGVGVTGATARSVVRRSSSAAWVSARCAVAGSVNQSSRVRQAMYPMAATVARPAKNVATANRVCCRAVPSR